MYFVTPRHPKLAMTQDFRTRLLDQGVHVREFDSFEDKVDGVPLIETLDCLYMTRIQREHNRPEDEEELREIFDELDAPVLRVTGADVPMPYNKRLEKAAKAEPVKIVSAAKQVLYLE